MSQHVCIYHAFCTDGFASAYAVWRMFGDDCAYIPASYGDDLPDVKGKDVYMVDFSYKRPELLKLAAQARVITILDHHDTAEQELVDLPSNVHVHFDQSKSGAVITWEFLHGFPVPYLLHIVQDRDLWQWKLPETKAVTAYLFSQPWTFETWHEWVTATPIKKLRERGQVLVDKQDKEVKALCDPVHVAMSTIPLNGGTAEVPTVNCPWMFASDVGHELCNQYPEAPCSITFMISRDKVKFSLRTNRDDFHCGEFATQLGGGGHPKAAGFSVGRMEFATGFMASAVRREQENAATAATQTD